MKPVEFKQQNAVLAKDQPEYQPLPAYVECEHPNRVISCWELTEEELLHIMQTRKLYLACMTFGKPLQPLFMAVNEADVFSINAPEARTRQDIKMLLERKRMLIKSLKAEIIELNKENALLCDEEQWFTEQEETTGRGKKKHTRLVGRIHFNQDFKDESTGEIITIERTEIVRIKGEWV